jgi:hypothetical protein
VTPLQIVRAFWPSIELRIDYDSSPGWEGQLVIRDPACRRDVAAWIREHERKIMDEMKAGGKPDKSQGETSWKRTKTKRRS